MTAPTVPRTSTSRTVAVPSCAHIDAGGDSVAERYVTIDGRRVRVGTYADAGRLCVSEASPSGVSAATYRDYAARGGTGRNRAPTAAPGPLSIPDPTDDTGERRIPLLEPGTRAAQIDLDAVVVWNAARPGPRGWQGALRRTPMTVQMLTAVRDGRLVVRPGADQGWWVLVDGEQLTPRRAGQVLSLLVSEKAVSAPDRAVLDEQRLDLLDEGREILTRWGLPPDRA